MVCIVVYKPPFFRVVVLWYNKNMKRFLFSLFFVTGFVAAPVYALGVADTDSDGLSDTDETAVYYTDVANPDTDVDGFLDGEEISHGFSPRVGEGKRLREVDSDNDGLWDDWEIALRTNLMSPDTDGDGYSDGLEMQNYFDPRDRAPGKLEKRIEVTLANQRAAYFFDGVRLDDFAISSGKPKTPTPTGSFEVLAKRPIVHYAGPGYDYPNTKWNLMFKRGRGLNYYLHGAWWHNNFGTVRSAGCVNVPHEYAYMGRLYDWAAVGTPISIR